MIIKSTDKIKLFRTLHGINFVYESSIGELFIKMPKNFTGVYLSWRDTGEKETKIHYKNGKEHGNSIVWHINGKKWWQIQWKNGKKHGKQIWYEITGKMRYSEIWSDGEKLKDFEMEG